MDAIKEFTKGAPDYDAIQILFNFVKEYRTVSWDKRPEVHQKMFDLISELHDNNDPRYSFVKFFLEGYDYAREELNR